MSTTMLSSARQRELFRYYQPADIDCEDNNKRTSSHDPCLTAFVQLGVLKLKYARGYISLSTGDPKHAYYVLAESISAFSLQKDEFEEDELWHGVGLAYNDSSGIGQALISEFNQPENSPKIIFIEDITKDEKYSKYYNEEFKIRSFLLVPLKSVMHGMVIGTYCLTDENPHESINEDDCQFLYDLATTVSDHLEAERVKRVQHRAERMIKALGLFIEGKSSLRDWWLETGHRTQRSHRKRATKQRPLELLADLEFGIQERVDYYTEHGLHELQVNKQPMPLNDASSNSSIYSSKKRSISESQALQDNTGLSIPSLRVAAPDTQTKSTSPNPRKSMVRNPSIITSDTNLTEPSPDMEKQSFISFEGTPGITSKESSQALLTSNIKKVFARASNLIRESISVEGVVYFDATNRSNNKISEINEPIEIVANDSSRLSSIASPEGYISPNSSETEAGTALQSCNVLGYSTKTSSSLYGSRELENLQKFPESIMRKLLEDYPHGSVFNFDEDGSPSFESHDLISDSYRESDRKKQSNAIIAALPGVRSVFWFPLWDPNHDRWYSGSFVWSTSPTRVLCPVEDLTCLATFGNSIMTEVSRLSAQVLSKMKTNFISSISHELRSPLHGVLASVEFLRETDMSELQIEMVNNIHASGKILLDTINHVLDFSKVNTRAKYGKKFNGLSRFKSESKKIPLGIDNADMCIISEEVIDTVFAGFVVSKKAFSHSNRETRHISSREVYPVSIIVEIPFRQNWTYGIDKGAWRRILMNLFSNAMKYTTVGYIKVSLDIEESSRTSNKKNNTHSTLVLKVKDSGRGMSADFLKFELYKPFTQEDALVPGAGLGLSIVQAIVHDVNGNIAFSSELGIGTEVIVRIPVEQNSIPKKVEERKLVTKVRSQCDGYTVRMVGFDRYPDLGEEPTGILSKESVSAINLRNSVESCLRDWFGVQTVTPLQSETTSNLVLIMESGLSNNSVDYILNSFCPRETKKKNVVIILTNRYHTTTKVAESENFKCFYLEQPFGPHKLCEILHQAFCIPDGDQAKTNRTSQKRFQLPIPEEPSEISTSPIISRQTSFDVSPPKPSKDISKTPSKPQALASETVSPFLNSCLPLRLNSSSHLETSYFSSNKDSSAKKDLRVLLVDDNDINLRLLIATMRRLKFDYATAVNGLEALNSYKKDLGRFDVILMDISMPIMSGTESSKHIRSFEKEKNLDAVMLIALTGAANERTRQEAYSCGIDLYLTKPVPMKVLRGMLNDLSLKGRKVVTR